MEQKSIAADEHPATARAGDAGAFDLATLQQRLVSTVLDCQDAVLVKDPAGIIRFWNSGAEHLYGWSSEEMLGRSMETITPTDRHLEWRRFLDAALKGQQTEAFETLRVHRDGSLVEVSVSVSPLSDETGEIVGASSVGRSITAQKTLERNLLAYQTKIDRMVERERMLADVSGLLAESFDAAGKLNTVGSMCVPVLGDLCSIDVVNDKGEIEQRRFGFDDADLSDRSLEIWSRFASFPQSATGPAQVIRTGKAQLYRSVTEEMVKRGISGSDAAAAVNALGVRSALIVPMQARGELVGAITLMITDETRSYEVEDLHFAQRLADRAGLAVDNARQWNERLMAEERLRESEAKYKLLADSQRALLWTAPADGRRTFFSDGWLAFTGISLAEALDWGWLSGVHPDDGERVEHDYLSAVALGQGCELEYRLRSADGSYRWVMDRSQPRQLEGAGHLVDSQEDVVDGDQAGTGYVGNCIDITDRKLGETELAWRATHDALTGLANRSYAYHRAAEQVRALRRHPGTVALLFIDVDNLKTVNDQLGHGAGDDLLRAVAECLSSVARKEELLARIGGDEFLLVTDSGADEATAADIAERLVAACSRLPESVRSLSVGISIGVATTSDPECGLDELIHEADSAMYAAKFAGGQSYRLADHSRRVPRSTSSAD